MALKMRAGEEGREATDDGNAADDDEAAAAATKEGADFDGLLWREEEEEEAEEALGEEGRVELVEDRDDTIAAAAPITPAPRYKSSTSLGSIFQKSFEPSVG
jgi:hypothetical protein